MVRAVPIHLPQAALPLLRNMQPETHPVQAVDPNRPCLNQIKIPIPKDQWNSDWLVSLEDDISWLADKFMADVGECIWIRETHRLHIQGNSVVCEYEDLEKRVVPVEPHQVRFDGRRMAPLCMLRMACRYVLKIHNIKVEWTDEKRTDLVWTIDVSRVGNVEEVLRSDK